MLAASPLLSILRAAHCHSTHHFFALDALPMVQTDAGRRLVKLILRHHDRYLIGAKDPDTRFRDFQNHVIHVTDGYWGGAPRVAHQWYDRMQRYLRCDRFSDAAHAAGVLSHYFTDPIQPLHTQQCDREKILHRPIEWSITKSYNAILRHWKEDDMRVVFQLSDGPGWLGEAMLHGARFANRKYSRLLDQYDFVAAVDNPAAGLNASLRASIAELFGLAITGWARVIERAASDAEAIRGQPLPFQSLLIPTTLASLRAPFRRWRCWMADRAEQLAVEELLDEFRQTGELKEHLPAEVDIVHRVVCVHQDEQRWQRERQARLASQETVVKVESGTRRRNEIEDPAPAVIPFVAQTDRSQVAPPQRLKRGSLAHQDALIAAPSIGANTAARFAAIHIHTVGELLAASAEDVAANLQTYWITADTVSAWQAQATLMCEVPRLNCIEAQLLAGAGYKVAAQVAGCDPATLHRDVCEFAATTRGVSIRSAMR